MTDSPVARQRGSQPYNKGAPKDLYRTWPFAVLIKPPNRMRQQEFLERRSNGHFTPRVDAHGELSDNMLYNVRARNSEWL